MGRNVQPRLVTEPNLSTVSKLICESWNRPCWNYDVGLLATYIQRPSGDSSMSVGLCSESGELVAFLAYIPYEVEYLKRRYRAVFGSFITIAREYQHRGLAKVMQQELIRRAIDNGSDLFLSIVEIGASGKHTHLRNLERNKMDHKPILVFGYRAALRDIVQPLLPESRSPRTRLYEKADKPAILPLIDSMGAGAPLRKIIPEEDVDFILADRPHCATYVYADKKIRALANILRFEVLEEDGSIARNVYFENVNFGNLDAEEQHSFLGDILHRLNDTGYHAVFIPDIGYVDHTAFSSFRFRLAPRQLSLYLSTLKPNVLPEGIKEVSSYFLDVY